MLIKNFCSSEKLTTLLLKYVSFYTIPLKEESFVKIPAGVARGLEKHDNHEISSALARVLRSASEKYKNSNDSYQSLDNEEENKKDIRFYEWLAGIIDGDGCFLVSKKGYCSLEIVTQLRDKKILYLIKQKFGGSVKLVSGNNHLRYRLHHKKGSALARVLRSASLLNLISKINGLMRNPIRVLQLGRICEIYGIELKDSKPLTYYSG
jgi:hypothetical protein